MTEMPDAKAVLTGLISERPCITDLTTTDTMTPRHYQQTEEDYQMAIKAIPGIPKKTKAETYRDEVEDLKKQGVSNADAIREVAKKHGATENAVRGGIHQYNARHGSGGSSATSRRGGRSQAPTRKSLDDYFADARRALEAARDQVTQEVTDAEAALQAAQKRYDEAKASVADRLADIEKKLKALA